MPSTRRSSRRPPARWRCSPIKSGEAPSISAVPRVRRSRQTTASTDVSPPALGPSVLGPSFSLQLPVQFFEFVKSREAALYSSPQLGSRAPPLALYLRLQAS